MYNSISKQFTVDYAHRLILDYSSKCSNLHGHTGKIELSVGFERPITTKNHMVIDFTHLKPIVAKLTDMFDHMTILHEQDEHHISLLNPTTRIMVVKQNPTAEFFCQLIAEEFAIFLNGLKEFNSIRSIISIKFWETPNNFAEYSTTVFDAIPPKDRVGSLYHILEKTKHCDPKDNIQDENKIKIPFNIFEKKPEQQDYISSADTIRFIKFDDNVTDWIDRVRIARNQKLIDKNASDLLSCIINILESKDSK